MKRMKFKVQIDIFKSFLRRNMLAVGIAIFIFSLGAVLVPRAFAQPVKSVEINSDSASFEEKDPGAWKVDKSAKWIGRGEAEITFDVDTIMKTNNKYTDVLFVLDVSGSMDGDKLNRVKSDSIELIESLLSNGENKAGLITFESTSDIVLDFTKDEELLERTVNSLTTAGSTNYYQALVNVDEVLKNYKKEKDRECVILFLTDGYPNEDTPNEETQYSYLKQQYPFITINGIQYEMGTNVLDPVKKVSDNQFIADMDTLNNVLFDASVMPITYDEFSITDYIDTNYFYVEDASNNKVSQGNVIFDNDTQKVKWDINGLKTGSKAKMIIKVKLKDEFIGQGGVYPTNKSEEIYSKLGEVEDNIVSDKTPVLLDNHKVIYDGNAPDGSSVTGVPSEESKTIFDVVGISETIPVCEGYQFKGWEITTKDVKKANDDYFVMPEEDVVIRAKWGKLSIDKAMDGKVYEYVPATLEEYNYGSTYGLHKYKSSITNIVFQNTMSEIGGAIEVLDISAEKNNGILAYIVPNEEDSTKYTAFIQGDGSVVANSNSGMLFYNFKYLKSIENLEYFDTSNVISMSSMFSGCSSLKSLNLSNFDTSNVTYMTSMFSNCSSLTSLDLSNFNTSKVTNMSYMFAYTRNLASINIGCFNTLKVRNMSCMFYYCNGLIELDLSKFDTSNVTNMEDMFNNCTSLKSIDLSGFNTSKVTSMHLMFCGCSSLVNLDLSNFNTLNVTNTMSMFCGCSSLTSLNLSNFNTSNSTTMYFMFKDCSNLTNLDLSSFNTSNVTDMNSMFSGCIGLLNLALSSFNTSKVTNMSSMFNDCSSLTSLDLSDFDTSKVTVMSSMFYGCNSLTSLDLRNFDTSNVTSMYSMFYGCSSLTTLDLSNFDTSSLTSMGYMFRECSSLTSLNLSKFDTTKVTNMSNMFYNCNNLASLNLTSFDTSNVKDISSMFAGCSNLTTTIMLDNKITNSYFYFSMFYNAATAEGAQITVNYTENSADVIDSYIGTKSSNSNVVKGELVTIGT